MVEFKYDPNLRNFLIIEVNPRYWGSLPLAVMSGVDFPVLHALSALEQDYEPVLEYRLGTKVRFLNKDMRSIIDSFSVERNWKRKIRILLDLVDFRIRDGLIAPDDLRPIFHGIFNSISRS
jgi:predicted ATP-grasp superfamily ATP-dependent carboligase